MSANIAANVAGGYSFAAREGVVVWWSREDHNVMTAKSTRDEWMKAAGLDYRVETAPVFMQLPSGEFVPVDDRMVTYRTDTNLAFDVISDHYKAHQNSELFDTAESIVSALNMVSGKDIAGAEAVFESAPEWRVCVAGALGKGERVWVGIDAPDSKVAIGGGAHNVNLSLLTGHDGTLASALLLSTTRIVCQNTMRAALNDQQGMFKIRHSRDYDQASMIEGFAAIIQGVARYKAIGDALATAKLAEAQVVAFFKGVAKIDPKLRQDEISTRKLNQYKALWDAWKVSATEGCDKDSAWCAWNAVTRYVDHDRMTDPAKRFDSANFGSGAALKADALANLRQLVAA